MQGIPSRSADAPFVLARQRYARDMAGRVAVIGLTVAVVATVAVLALSRDDGPKAAKPTSASLAEATCSSANGPSVSWKARRVDAVLGPLVLVGGRGRRDFGPSRGGYKVPVLLRDGVVATLSVPASLRGRVGLVYRSSLTGAADVTDARAADPAVRFSACPVRSEQQRYTGWTGGVLVDRPRCVTLVATLADGTSIRGRLPLGRRC